MRITDLLEEIYLGVSSNKVRSGLTMLGIVIGIASVIAMLSVGQGAQQSVEANIQSLGSNLLVVMPGATRGVGQAVSAGRGSAQSLTDADETAIEGLSGIGAVDSEVTKREQITARGTNTNTSVIGTSPSYPTVRNVTIADGAFFSDAQVTSRAKVAILGPTTRDDLFGVGAEAVGQAIRINGMDFSVIGVAASKGGTGVSNTDDQIYIPITSMQTFLSGGTTLSSISIQASSQSAMTQVQNDVTNLLLDRHHISDPAAADFNVLNQSDLVSTAAGVEQTFTVMLASIAGISLLVGGIGIMNMMLTTVTERTREIGLRQAIGAERPEIVGQFLGEAVLLTLMGGTIGIIIGYVASLAIAAFAKTPTDVAWSSVALAFGVSAVIGLVFGFYPARRAAGLNPIEALRFE
ncbi:MAG: ABC transporter permease [Patescibacteria group bacterium]